MSDHVEAKIEEYKRCGCGHCSDFLKTFSHMLAENRQLTAALAERDEARERVKELESSLRIAELGEERDRLSAQLDTAWQQGAEAMREAAAKIAGTVDHWADPECSAPDYQLIRDAIRALPVPERKEG